MCVSARVFVGSAHERVQTPSTKCHPANYPNPTLPLQTIVDAKHLIGRKYDDPVVQRDAKHWPFKVVNDSSTPKIQVAYKGEPKR